MPGWDQSRVRFAVKLAVGFVIVAVAAASGAGWIGIVVASLVVAAWSLFESRFSAAHATRGGSLEARKRWWRRTS
jgi:hypothetical protein